MGIRTGSILRETSTDRIPSRRRRQQVPEAREPLPPTSAEPLANITPAGALGRKPKTSPGIEVYFDKKPNHISTGSRYRILTGARNATTPKEPQCSEETDQPKETGHPDGSKAGEPRKNLPRDNRHHYRSDRGRLVRLLVSPIIQWSAGLLNSCADRRNDSRSESDYLESKRHWHQQLRWYRSTIRRALDGSECKH